jgi:hypothetical protein
MVTRAPATAIGATESWFCRVVRLPNRHACDDRPDRPTRGDLLPTRDDHPPDARRSPARRATIARPSRRLKPGG